MEGETNYQQMILFLQNYLRLKTYAPAPVYTEALALFEQQAKLDGLLYQSVLLPSGNSVGVISYEGSDKSLPALALNHHMDVVPVAAEDFEVWDADPFEGAIIGDYLIGRGTQDMKSVGVLHYFAVRALKLQGIKPKRTIHCLLMPDEEQGGFKGMKEFIETEVFKKLNIGFCLDEGVPSGDSQKISIKISEKKPLQISIISQGIAAHASSLRAHNALHELVLFLGHLVKWHADEQERENTCSAGYCLSFNITSLEAGVENIGRGAFNIIPSYAKATMDIRVAPIVSLKEVERSLQHLIEQFPSISYSIQAQAEDIVWPDVSDSFLLKYLEKSILKSGKKADLIVFEGATDSRFLIKQGIEAIGITPFVIAPNLHGTNEKVSLEDLRLGLDIFTDFIESF